MFNVACIQITSDNNVFSNLEKTADLIINSIKNIKAETDALHFSINLAEARAVPPVAIKSSIIITLSFLFKEDL